VAVKRKVATKPVKTAKKAVKKEVAKKAPAKKAVVKKPRARNNHKVGAATTAAVLGLAATPAKRAAQKKKGNQAGHRREMGETKTAFARTSGQVD